TDDDGLKVVTVRDQPVTRIADQLDSLVRILGREAVGRGGGSAEKRSADSTVAIRHSFIKIKRSHGSCLTCRWWWSCAPCSDDSASRPNRHEREDHPCQPRHCRCETL